MSRKFQISNFKFQIFRKLYPNYGFTLLELLVVISIIVILTTLGITSFTTAQKKSRDAKRKSDVKEIQSSLEQYYSICGLLYPTAANGYYTSIICVTPGVSIAILPTVPSDPKATPYFCPTPIASTCTSSVYTLCTNLESESPASFCVSNQQ